MKTFSLIPLLALLFAGDTMALSPPWYLLQRQIATAIGADTNVRVDELDTTTSPYRISVHVADSTQAQALASILTPHYEMGNLAVDIIVLDSLGAQVQPLPLTTQDQVANAFNTALRTNPLFVLVFEAPASFFKPGGVGVVFAKVLVQYWSDDLGELFGNTNVSAAALFANLLVMRYDNISVKLGTSTW